MTHNTLQDEVFNRSGYWEAICAVKYYRDVATTSKQQFLFDCTSTNTFQEFLIEAVDVRFQSNKVFVPSIVIADLILYIGSTVYIKMPSEIMPVSLGDKKLRILPLQNCGIEFNCFNVDEEVSFTISLIGTLFRRK